jgi:hypothetical protein
LKPPFKNEFSIELWKEFSKNSNSFSSQEYVKSNFFYLTTNFFVHQKILRKRTSIGILLIELAIEGLDQYSTKTQKHYCSFVLSPAIQNLINFSSTWLQNKAQYQALSEAVKHFPIEKIKSFDVSAFFIDFVNVIPHNIYYPLKFFLTHKIVDSHFILFDLIPRSFQSEIENQENHQKHLYNTIKLILMDHTFQLTQFLVTLRSLNADETNHPLSKLWPIFLSRLPDVALEEFTNFNNNSILYYLINQLQPLNPFIVNPPSSSIFLSFDEIIAILTKVIRGIIDSKSNFVQNAASKYTELLSSLLQLLLNHLNWENNVIWTEIHQTPFSMLPVELRDDLITELMSDPLGQKTLNPYLSKQPTTVSLSLSLLIDDLQKLSRSIAPNKTNQLDQYGFQKNVKIAFPPLQTEVSTNSEETIETVHIFERYLFQSIRHKNASIVIRTFNTYKAFVLKLLLKAYETNDDILFDLASDSHFRLCRFCLGQSTSSNQLFLVEQFYSFVLHPLSVYAGMKSKENYAQFVFDNLIDKYHSYTQNDSPFGVILHTFCVHSYCNKLPGIENVYSKVSELIINRLYQDIPSTLNFTFRRSGFQDLSFIRDP